MDREDAWAPRDDSRATPARAYQIRLWLGAGGVGWLELLTALGHAAGAVADDAFRVDTA